MAAFLPLAVLLSLLVTGTTAGGYGSQTTPSTSTPASYTPTPATPPPPPPSPYTPQPATPPKPAHDYDDDNKLVAVAVRVVVEGQVLCHSCAERSLDAAAPLPKAQVMVTCRDHRKDSVMAQQLSVADSNGHFHVELSVEHADSHVACLVRLVSSPDHKCNMVSDIHLHDEGKHWIDDRGFRNIVYAARQLAFRPRECAPTLHH